MANNPPTDAVTALRAAIAEMTRCANECGEQVHANTYWNCIGIVERAIEDAAPPEDAPAVDGGDAVRDRAAFLLDSPAWQIHPDTISHEEAGSLLVWAQDVSALLWEIAVPPCAVCEGQGGWRDPVCCGRMVDGECCGDPDESAERCAACGGDGIAATPAPAVEREAERIEDAEALLAGLGYEWSGKAWWRPTPPAEAREPVGDALRALERVARDDYPDDATRLRDVDVVWAVLVQLRDTPRDAEDAAVCYCGDPYLRTIVKDEFASALLAAGVEFMPEGYLEAVADEVVRRAFDPGGDTK